MVYAEAIVRLHTNQMLAAKDMIRLRNVKSIRGARGHGSMQLENSRRKGVQRISHKRY